MWIFHSVGIFTFERGTFSVIHIFSITVHHQWWSIWWMMRGYYVSLLYAKNTQLGIVSVLRLLPPTDSHLGKRVHPSLFATEVSAVFLLCGKEPWQAFVPCRRWEAPEKRWGRLGRGAPFLLLSTARVLKSDTRSEAELGFCVDFLFLGFPFQTGFVKSTLQLCFLKDGFVVLGCLTILRRFIQL